jgi:hypothetical protein
MSRHDAIKIMKGRKPDPAPNVAKFPLFVNFVKSISRDGSSISHQIFIYNWSSKTPN